MRLLLDEHYPGWLADALVEHGIDAVALTRDRPEQRGVDDTTVLRAAVGEGRIVVTEDVSTFRAAIAQVPDHLGVIFCHHRRFPRTRTGLRLLADALQTISQDSPTGLGAQPIEWWLDR